jgi:hypothetical protein
VPDVHKTGVTLACGRSMIWLLGMSRYGYGYLVPLSSAAEGTLALDANNVGVECPVVAIFLRLLS